MPRRDVVVVGASMGGITALKQLVATLPADFPAALCVVQHVAPVSPGFLATILAGAGSLPATLVESEAQLQPAQIFVAPPDRHLVLRNGLAAAVYGPRENRSRPAIDPLFRSAAVDHRSSAIGVLLTGLLDDGVAGLHAIKTCGGVTIVQEPRDAEYPEMPNHAIERVQVDHVLPVADMGELLARLVRQEAPEPPPVPDLIRTENLITQRMMNSADRPNLQGKPTRLTCPDCGGTLDEIDHETGTRLRCHTGHSFTLLSLMAEHDDSIEKALWAALRALEERTNMLGRMAEEDTGSLEQRLSEARENTERVRALLQQVVTS